MTRVLFVISGDPRVSHRPAEAIRIAAGVGAWKRADITVCLREAAVLVLSDSGEGFVDEENYTQYLPMLRDFGRPIYVHGGVRLPVNSSAFEVQEIDDVQLAALAAKSECVLHF